MILLGVVLGLVLGGLLLSCMWILGVYGDTAVNARYAPIVTLVFVLAALGVIAYVLGWGY